jgi:hypothetical protein
MTKYALKRLLVMTHARVGVGLSSTLLIPQVRRWFPWHGVLVPPTPRLLP